MSTKATKTYGDGFHLYRDMHHCEDSVFLELDLTSRVEVASHPDGSRVVVLIPEAVWNDLRRKIARECSGPDENFG